jgi:hypothetical protein
MMEIKVNEIVNKENNIDNYINNKCRILLGSVVDYSHKFGDKSCRLTQVRQKKRRVIMSDDDYIERDYKSEVENWMDDWSSYVGEYR